MHLVILAVCAVVAFGIGAAVGQSWEQKAIAEAIAFKQRMEIDARQIVNDIRVRVEGVIDKL